MEGRKKALEDIGLEIKSIAELPYNHEERNKLFPGRVMLLSFNYTPTANMYGIISILSITSYMESWNILNISSLAMAMNFA